MHKSTNYKSTNYKSITYKSIAITLLTFSLVAGPASANDETPRPNDDGVAAHLEIIPGGYDVVEAMESGKQIRGKVRYSHSHEGKVYIFANRTNRDLFVADPDRYLETPQG